MRVDSDIAALEREIQELLTPAGSDLREHASVADLRAAMQRHVGGGKLVRPQLFLDAVTALSTGRPPIERATALRIAAAIELLHFAFLLHDDVIDGDRQRRGRPNLIADLEATAAANDAGAHWAVTGGLLAGDLVLARALRAVALLDLPTTVRGQLIDLFDHVIGESVAGEWLDVGLADGQVPPDLDTVLRMSARKTAAYTFALPLGAAAILSDASPDVAERLTTAGTHLGLAFQLQDDLLSTYGDPEQHGKDALADLRAGKQTALVAYARTTPSAGDVHRILGTDDATVLSTLPGLLESCGARSYVTDRIATELATLDALIEVDFADDPGAADLGAVVLRLRADLTDRVA